MKKTILKRSFITLIALLQISLFPALGYAEVVAPATEAPIQTSEQTPAPTQSEPTNTPSPVIAEPSSPTAPVVQTPPPPATGPTSPTGAESKAYHLNPATGLYESEKYVWNPSTGQTTPKTAPKYSYNPATGKWDTVEWRYNAPTSGYIPNTVSTPTPPLNSQTVNGVIPSPATARTGSAQATSGPGSSSALTNSSSSNSMYNQFYNAQISNSVTSNALSGSVSVGSNTLVGDAMSGNASAQATLLNLLQSVWNPSNGPVATFNANIDGDVVGDLLFDPASVGRVTNSSTDQRDLTVHVSNDTNLDNALTVTAASGDASALKNTEAGNVSTGTATAVANVVNMLNSVIGSGQSFIGTVNINGNLNGDILLPPQMLQDLLASNVPRATIQTSNLNNASILANFNANTAIQNNVNATAGSGSVTANSNTASGNATSGDVDTNVTVLNLTGRQIIGTDAMLVFVNVLGKWVGMIMDAPGATSAAIGGGITSNTENDLNAAINTDENTTITNNINLKAQSGDATATSNTKVGNVSSGAAKAAANIANVSNSTINVGGWFGILFINVFGNWLGSFGVNTSAGNVASSTSMPSQPPKDVQVFKFVPSAPSSSKNTYTLSSVPTSGSLGTGAVDSKAAKTTSVLGDSDSGDSSSGFATPLFRTQSNIVRAYIGLAVASVVLYGGSKIVLYFLARRRLSF